jgi:predicted permease
VAFTALLTLAAGLLAGLGPALQSTRADLARDLAEGSRGNVQRRSSLRGALTVAQGALSVVLLVGAGLFIRSIGEVRGLDIGIDADRLALARLEFRGERPDAAEKTRVYEEAARIARGLPGATGAATSETVFGWSRMGNITVPGYDSLPVPTGAGPFYYGVSPQYLGTVGLRLLQGRPILETDVEGTPSVAVVNVTMARTLWPSGDAVGACFHVRGTENCTTVVGVAEDAARWGLEDDPYLAYYLPLAQLGSAPEGLYVRTEGDPHALVAALAPALRSFSSEVRFAEVQAFTEILDPQMRSWTLGATLFTAFGALALLVAAIGLYSVLAFDVTRQTREIGIRSALGATKTTILRGVVVNAARLAAMGIALGLAAAAAAAPLVQDLLFQVEPRELRVMGAVAALLLAVALLASAVPALRATRVDPMEALRID